MALVKSPETVEVRLVEVAAPRRMVLVEALVRVVLLVEVVLLMVAVLLLMSAVVLLR